MIEPSTTERLRRSMNELQVTKAAIDFLADLWAVLDPDDPIIKALKTGIAHAAQAEWLANTATGFEGNIVIVENLDGRKFVYDLATRQEVVGAA